MVCVSSHFDGVSVCFLGNKDTHLYVFSRSDHPCLCVSSMCSVGQTISVCVCPVTLTVSERWCSTRWSRCSSQPLRITCSSCGTSRRPSRPSGQSNPSTHSSIMRYSLTVLRFISSSGFKVKEEVLFPSQQSMCVSLPTSGVWTVITGEPIRSIL